MKHFFVNLLLASTLAGGAQAAPVIADWRFSEPAGTTLNQTVNQGLGLNGAGGTWGLALTGSATQANGQFLIGNDGKGGSGTRTAYADFGLALDSISTGTVSLYASIAAWNPAQPGSRFSLGFIEGNDFGTAGFSVAAAAGGFTLAGEVDPFSDGSALESPAQLAAQGPFTLRLDLNLDTLLYALAYDLGAGFMSVGSGAVDSWTAGVNSLRMGVEGDFSSAPLLLDRIWMTQGEPAFGVPEPTSLGLFLTALLMLPVLRRRVG